MFIEGEYFSVKGIEGYWERLCENGILGLNGWGVLEFGVGFCTCFLYFCMV